jgi:4-amino-4-deoxy-L-arabinose transferase-like glycosyltransferase
MGGVNMPFSKRELLLLALIVAVATCLRLYRLDEIPPGLAGDTAYKGVAANRILAGEHPIFFAESWGGIEPMYMYLLAALFKLLGSTPLAIKLLSAFIGIVTIPLLHLLVRQLLASRGAGLLASSWLAISYWHVSYSRLGWEIILGPLFVVLTLYFLWRGMARNRWREFVWTGMALGASLYTYQALRFLPVLILCYLGYRTVVEKGFWREYGPKLALCLLVALVVFAPLGAYFATHADVFLRRAGEVSIFNPEKNSQGPLRSLFESSLRVLGTYNLRGDPYWRHNLPGRPAFDILTSVLFFVGLAVSVTRYRERSYSLLLLWLVILSLPPILTPPRDVPHFSRSIGALPAACVFPALGVEWIWHWFRTRRPSSGTRVFAAVCVAGVLATSATLTVRDYFVVWAGNPDLRDHYFDGQFVDLAAAMNEMDDPEGVWILPISALASPHDEAGHHTIEFLYRGQAPLHFLSLDESTVADELSELTQGRTRALLVDYKDYVLEEAYNYIDADPKQLMPFLLGKYGSLLERQEYESFDVQVWQLSTIRDFRIADSLDPQSANFGGQLLLTAADWGARGMAQPEESLLPSGGQASVVLEWRSLTDLEQDYKVALVLLDRRGRVVGQVDKLLLSNQLRMTSQWEKDQEEMDYYVLPNLPATPPGEYDIDAVVYEVATMDRLPILDEPGQVRGHSHTVGRVTITESAAPAVVEPALKTTDGVIVPEVQLLGFDLPREQVNPGDALEVALYWRALRDVADDYVVVVELSDAQGRVWAREESKPAYGDYPTTEWDEGEVIRDWHEALVDAETPTGDYGLSVGLTEDGQLAGHLDLGVVHVSGRARCYDVPPMETRLGWLLGDSVRLLGYDLEHSVEVGEPLRLTLYWQCVAEMTTSYTVFTHLLDVDNVVRGQVDQPPLAGEALTTSWVEGEVIADIYEIPVDPDAPAGEYVVEIGMYEAATMDRLEAYDAQGTLQGDMVLLDSVLVRR